MNSDKIKETLNKIPIGLLLFCYLAYLGYDFYLFTNDSASPLILKENEIKTARDTKNKLEGKLKTANAFVKSLEEKKQELRKLALELQGMKESLSEKSDVPAFMKLVITEAKRLGLTIVGLKPTGTEDKEYYTEATFAMKYRGVFAQVTAFLDRLANVSEIVRVENIEMKPIGSAKARFVMLEGSVDIKIYKYRGSNADEVGKKDPFAPSAIHSPAPGANHSKVKGAGA